RTLLVRLKYEKDAGVRKAISDAIEEFLITGGREGGRRDSEFLGVDQSIIEYLNDKNPEVRKNALKIIQKMEYNPNILNILLERLKVETDDEVKTLIEQTIDIISSGTFGGRRGISPAGAR
ncbi:MAG: HEAT repeat domain-containing protein, partial [Candidatus Omnitrophica bacterium]|nr:HEAT repeat domain-containing protein [Candidatus Omnitrophota bacterium]